MVKSGLTGWRYTSPTQGKRAAGEPQPCRGWVGAEGSTEKSQKRGYSPPYHLAKSVPVLKHEQMYKQSCKSKCSRPCFNIHPPLFLAVYSNESCVPEESGFLQLAFSCYLFVFSVSCSWINIPAEREAPAQAPSTGGWWPSRAGGQQDIAGQGGTQAHGVQRRQVQSWAGGAAMLNLWPYRKPKVTMLLMSLPQQLLPNVRLGESETWLMPETHFCVEIWISHFILKARVSPEFGTHFWSIWKRPDC